MDDDVSGFKPPPPPSAETFCSSPPLSLCTIPLCCLKWIKEGLQRLNLTDHEFLRPISCDDTGSSNENDNVTHARRRRRDV